MKNAYFDKQHKHRHVIFWLNKIKENTELGTLVYFMFIC